MKPWNRCKQSKSWKQCGTLALATFVLVGSAACGTPPQVAPLAKPSPSATPGGKIGFSDVESIFKAKCQSCHAAANGERKPLMTLANVKLVRHASLARLNASDDSVMPPADLDFKGSDDGKKLIQYLTEGREMNPMPGANTDTSNTSLTYAGIKSILNSNCTSCHQGATPSGKYDTSTAENAAKQAVKSADYMQAKGRTMPTGGRIDSTPDGKKLLEWFQAGAPK